MVETDMLCNLAVGNITQRRDAKAAIFIFICAGFTTKSFNAVNETNQKQQNNQQT
jgi:hypothetical protein